MALFGLIDTRDLEEFASALASDLARRFPPESEKRTDVGATNQLKVILEGLTTRALRYHETHKLGVYKKAKLANVFRWKLAEFGYSEAFVDKATREVATKLAARSRKVP